MHKIKTEIGCDVQRAAALLAAGELVAIPTETVYGLAGNALNENAVLEIFKAKERPQFNPLIIHLAYWQDVDRYTTQVPEAAKLLAARFMPGPLTLLLTKNDTIPDLVTAGSGKVAVRIPAHPLTHSLLQQLHFPLAAPSANLYGYVSPVDARHVMESLGGRIPYILDGGPCEVGLESTIVDFENDEAIIRRTGKIGPEHLAQVLGQPVRMATQANEHPVAPGMLAVHYATATPLFYGKSNWGFLENRYRHILLLGWGTEEEIKKLYNALPANLNIAVKSLSYSKTLDEAAGNLFRMMRQADREGYDAICVHSFPLEGIGHAIHDRLTRAGLKHDG